MFEKESNDTSITDPESQLDRIEKKMDRILELLKNKNLSISLDGKGITKEIETMRIGVKNGRISVNQE